MNRLLITPLLLCSIYVQAFEVDMRPISGIGPNASLSRLSTNYNQGEPQTTLSWVEENGENATLKFSTFNNNAWSDAKTVASGTNWFNNWADFPSVIKHGSLLTAHWLEKTDVGKYDYKIQLSQSNDKGVNWSSPLTPHQTKIHAEHGFVSLLPLGKETFAVWLDGRHTKSFNHSHHHSNTESMMLRAATFKNGQLYNEWLLDERVCDCCATAAVTTDKGVIVAYRGRTGHEIRDTKILRLIDGKWQPANYIPTDNWQIDGCPVNGPSLSAKGKMVALSWYTVQNNKATVKLSISNDYGDNFLPSIVVSQNTIGRIDTTFHNGFLIVSHLDNNSNRVSLILSRYTLRGELVDRNTVVQLSPSRTTGFPTLTSHNDKLLVSWNSNTVHTAVINFPVRKD
ncbi:hypothetical protein [Vibrio paucivorans]